jgi:hypothetical protein
MDHATTIARDAQPSWEQTFDHPEHGKLTFKVPKLPTTMDWLRVESTREQLAPAIAAGAGAGAALSEAIAGILALMSRPVIREERFEDPDTPGHEKLKQTLYDPREDPRFEFALVVWGAFNVWRNDVLSISAAPSTTTESHVSSASEPASAENATDGTE